MKHNTDSCPPQRHLLSALGNFAWEFGFQLWISGFWAAFLILLSTSWRRTWGLVKHPWRRVSAPYPAHTDMGTEKCPPPTKGLCPHPWNPWIYSLTWWKGLCRCDFIKILSWEGLSRIIPGSPGSSPGSLQEKETRESAAEKEMVTKEAEVRGIGLLALKREKGPGAKECGTF